MLMTRPETKPAAPSPRPLEGRAAIVTGSTSGIGLGFAWALALAGAKVMLNGFGEADEIETIRAGLAEESGSEICFDGADMSRPTAIASLVRGRRRRVRQGRHPGQQRRHPVRRPTGTVPGREMGRHPGDQPELGLPRHPARHPRHEGARLGPDR